MSRDVRLSAPNGTPGSTAIASTESATTPRTMPIASIALRMTPLYARVGGRRYRAVTAALRSIDPAEPAPLHRRPSGQPIQLQHRSPATALGEPPGPARGGAGDG